MTRLQKISLAVIFAVCAAVCAPGAFAQVAGPNVNMVSGTSWPGGDPFLQRQNEPSMAVSTRNPMHILAGANDYRTVDLELALSGGGETGDSWLGLFKSFDGGLTWQSTLLPGCKYAVPQCQDSNGSSGSVLTGIYDAGSDPVVRAGTNGMFYYAGLAFDRATSATTASSVSSIFVARYNDLNNNENSDPITYIDTHIVASGNSSQFLDKPALAVDIPRSGANTCSFTAKEPGVGPGGSALSVHQSFAGGNVYMTYTDFLAPTKANSTPTHLMFTHSKDCGVTWSTPIQINSGTTTSQGSAIAINALNGNVYVVWRQFASTGIPDAMMVVQSTNAGGSFSKPVSISTFQPFDQGTTGTSFRTNAYPSITTDFFGFVYVAFSAKGLVSSGDARVVAAGSIDGTHWTPAIMVDNPSKNALTNPSGRGHQIMPAITFANGRLTLLYYDLRLDHYQDDYTSSPSSPTGYTATLTPEGELAGSSPNPAKVFTPFIDDAGLTLRRHTLDMRVLQLGIFPTITLGPSVLVSQYAYGCCVTPSMPDIEQFKFNVPNLPIFDSGQEPFLGDYIDVVPSPAFVPSGSSWVYNFTPSVNPLFHATWTDNRDVVPPANGDWTHYTPPVPAGTTSVFQPGQPVVCTPGQEGMRNQNIYTAQITGGLIVGAPGNSKPLGTTVFPLPPLKGTAVPFQRAFVVEAQNVTNSLINVRFTIANQPTGGKASFMQFSQLTTLDVSIPALSSVSRSVFVTSTNAEATVTVNVVQIGSIGGSPTTNGLSQSAVLNPDVTNPNITNPNVTNPNVTNPNVTNYEVTNPNITNPNITNPNITNPNITNPNITNPNITNPNVTNPNVTNVSATNPNVTNPNITNPDVTNPNITNPNITNPNVTNGSIEDVIYPITNNGNTTAAYTVQVASTQNLPTGLLLQLILDKLYQTPVAIDCQLTNETHWVTVANITNPKLYAPTDPKLGTPNITNSTPNEGSITLAPGETGYIDFRVISTTGAPITINPLNFVTPVTVPQAVNTQTALANPGGIVPPVTVPPLFIVTTTLPDAVVGHAYSATLTGQGGNPGPYIWSVPPGTLPAGLTLNTATGTISGTPTAPGTFPFAIQLKDTAIGTQFPQHTTSPSTFIIHVASPLSLNPAPLVGTTPLTGGTQGTAYNQTILPVGGFGTVTISQISGSLPAGLNFNNGGITGTPTGTGLSTFTVRATDSSTPAQTLTAVYSINIVSSVPVPGNVVFVAQPLNSTGGQLLGGSPVTVQVFDSTHAVIAGAHVAMTFNGTPACSTAVLSGTLTQTTGATGIASFPDLSVDRGQIGYTLLATVVGAPASFSGTSNAFTVNGFCGTGSLSVARDNLTATLLNNGNVLVAGGQNTSESNAADIYNPAAGTFTAASPLQAARYQHTATLLNDGTVLIVGGRNSAGWVATAEIFNPTNGTFTNTANPPGSPRSGHTATLLADGTVLIAGGFYNSNFLNTAEVYNPSTQTFTSVGPMHTQRYEHTATLLSNGQVLLATGLDATAEIYDPVAQTFALTGSLNTARQSPTATLLSNGKVLIAGGLVSGSTGIQTAELYDPFAGTFSFTGSLVNARGFHTAALLTDGTVLVAGGFDVSVNPDILMSAEIYNPSTSSFSSTGAMTQNRWESTAAVLNDGTVLTAGGFGGNSPLASAERFYSTSPLAPMLFTTTANPANGTTVSSNSTAFSQNVNNISTLGFGGILDGQPYLSFNPLTVSGVNFTATGANVNVTPSNFYSPNDYPTDFIVNSSDDPTTNQVTITLPQPATAIGMDYGILGSAFASGNTGTITLSNGFSLPLTNLPGVGQTQFSGFASSTPFSSLTYTVSGNDWVVTDLLLATANISLPNAKETNSYGAVLLEQGGVGPLTWTLASGTLPNGLSLSSSGVISGIPTIGSAGTAPGTTYTFAVHVVDSSNPQKSFTSGNLTLMVTPASF
jgi:Putative Ig domain/Galactose oxidase, central domain